jgi:hypothetical protein
VRYKLSSIIIFQIGVSAVFVSMYAQSRLNVPQDPPQTQEDLLATALQPIISFVVLGSILTRTSFSTFPALYYMLTLFTDGLSIPLFSVFQYITRLKARVRPQMDVETPVLAANSAKIFESDQPTRREAEIGPFVSPSL